jgi:hypothetical protein
MGLRNETGTHRGHRMRKRIEPVGIPRIHAGEDVNEGFMMDPEASVSALAFIHPDCSYSSVGEE